MQDIIVKTFLAIEAHVNTLVLRHCRSSTCFEVFGVDVLVDDRLKPWLIEVNVSPSLNQNSKLDFHVKEGMLADALNLVGFKLPTPGQWQDVGKPKSTSTTKLYKAQSVTSSASTSTVGAQGSASMTSTLATSVMSEYQQVLEIKNLNRLKRTKFVSKWKTMALAEKLQILKDLSIEDKMILRKYED